MTAQITDIIQYRNKYYSISDHEYILEQYLDSKGYTRQFFVENDGFILINSACRRGYVAIWEIRDSKLFLADVRAPGLLHSFKNMIFQDTKINEIIHADWYSGSILLSGLYDSKDAFIDMPPPNITNVIAINHNAESGLKYDAVDELSATELRHCYAVEIHNGFISNISIIEDS